MKKFTTLENKKFIDINTLKLDSELIYITEDNKQVGSLILCFSDGKANVFSVSILEEYRGKGYSKKLMNAAIDRAKQRESNIMILATEQTNEIANNLYKGMGFEFTNLENNYNNYQLML